MSCDLEHSNAFASDVASVLMWFYVSVIFHHVQFGKTRGLHAKRNSFAEGTAVMAS